jgi:hypothetical protein
VAEYAIFRFNANGEKNSPPLIFVETEEGIVRYSTNKENDKKFAEWYAETSKEPSSKSFTFDDYIGYGWDYYDSEGGEYSGEAKKRVDAMIAQLERGNIKIVKA